MQREGPPSLFLCRSFPQALTADAEWGMIEKIRRAFFLIRPESVADDALPDPCRLREREKRAAERKEREKT